MKRSIVWLIPLLVVALCVAVRVAGPGTLQTIRFQVFDEMQRLFRAHWEDTGVRVVDIDEDSLARIGQWPWPRTRVAEMIDRLTEAGALAIAFDVVFAEPDRTSPAQIAPLWGNNPEVVRLARELPDHDDVLAATVARSPVVLGIALGNAPRPAGPAPTIRAGFATAGDDPRPMLLSYQTATLNLPSLDAAARAQGNFVIDFERDGIVRRVPLVSALERPDGPAQLVPSLSVEAIRVAIGGSGYIIRSAEASGQTAYGGGSGINAIRITPRIAAAGEMRIDPIDIDTDPQGRLWLRDPGAVPARVIPAWRIFDRSVPAEEIDGNILFVGTSAAGLRDLRATPLDAAAAGVTVHARIAEQILRREFLWAPDWALALELLWLVVNGALIILLLPRTGPVVAAVIGAIGIVSPFAFSAGAMLQLGKLFDPIYPAASVLLVYLVQTLLIFSTREAERRHVRGAFSRYLSPTVVETLARHPERLQLGGEMRELSILFCDIRGFTTRSERMQAQELTQFLNSFLTPMTDCILAEGGTIDKYMGDAIMAFWNAPLEHPDHPAAIARASLAMIARLAELNRVWAAEAAQAGRDFEPLAIGVGINLGPACVGNMGSEQRFDYSIIGDSVNTASRLEGLSKTYGVAIVVGEALAARIPQFGLVPLDNARVKGKLHAVRVFALLGGPSPTPDPKIAALAQAHAAVLEALERGDAAAATAALDAARALGEPRLATTQALYAERVAALGRGAVPQQVALADH